jgi:uncharacterized protein YndB with AHSA1/START domain
MNITGSHKVTVKASLKDVFERFNDPNIQSEWVVQPFTLLSFTAPLQQGSVYTVKGKFLNKPTEYKYEVVEFNPPTHIVLKLHGTGTGYIVIKFKAVEGGTEIDLQFNRDFSAWLSSYAAMEVHNALYDVTEADLNSFKAFVAR